LADSLVGHRNRVQKYNFFQIWQKKCIFVVGFAVQTITNTINNEKVSNLHYGRNNASGRGLPG
jgi:hypothetical protein